MIDKSMTKKSPTSGLGQTTWFYRSNISLDYSSDKNGRRNQFSSDLAEYKEIFNKNEDGWIDDCLSQTLQLFVTQSARMNQIKKMSRTFQIGLILAVAVLFIDLILRFFIFTFFHV